MLVKAGGFKLLSTILTSIVISALLGLLLWQRQSLFFFFNPSTVYSKSEITFLSPIASSDPNIGENIWLPKSEVLGAQSVNISAQSAFFIDASTGDVLFSKDPHQKLKIASVTKIMTAIVALDHKGMDDKFVVTKQASQIMPEKMYLKPGEILTLRELLSGLFLVSANDAAETIADDTFGNRDDFIKQMNQKALEIGMNESKFTNPTGLDSDDIHGNNVGFEQYSTAYDVALMARYALSHWPELLQITSKPEIVLAQNSTHQEYDLETTISLVQSYPGVLGFKTGYTDEANYTLVTAAQKNMKPVIGVLLGGDKLRDDGRLLLDYSFKALDPETRVATASATIATPSAKKAKTPTK